MRALRLVLVGALVAGLVFGLVTLVALEGGDVAVLVTTAADGSVRRTHVWFAEDDGAYWIESATAERPFYVDLQTHPDLLMEIRHSPTDRVTTRLHGHAEMVAEPGGHDRIRSLLAAHYGWADKWIALLQDTSASRAVRVVVADAPASHH